jgi:hypothetical protein
VCNCSVLLELAEEVLHQVARLVHLPVKGALDPSIALGWDHELFSCRKQRFDHALVGSEGFIREQGIGLHLRQERIGSFQVMGLAGSQEKRSGIAQCGLLASTFLSLVFVPAVFTVMDDFGRILAASFRALSGRKM